MKCKKCEKDMEKGWRYCPHCGHKPEGLFGGFLSISDIFSRMRKEMDQMAKDVDEDFEKDIEAFDISPWFNEIQNIQKPVKKGFTIRIVSGTGKEPEVDIKTFGDVEKAGLEKQLTEMGIRPEHRTHEKPREEKPRLPAPKITEEPVTDVKRLDSRVVVDMEIPGVRGEEDIEINELEASVEVKAIAGDKAYFKILTKPEQFSLVKKDFSKGRLHLEFS
jgi:HSP20 family molecular chaperone IbpA